MTTSGSQPGPSGASLKLSNDVFSRFKPAKIFKTAVEPGPAVGPTGRPVPSGSRQITGICFDDRGETIITAGEDERFCTYNCKNRTGKTLFSKKYGVDLPRFTHKSTAIVYASTKEDDTIRYHSLHDNKYLQGRVISLEVSPIDDGFMSGSLDKTVRLWDLRQPTCRGLLAVPEPPVVAYDSGANFRQGAVPQPSLWKTRLSALVSFPPRPIFMTSLSFSSNGKYLLVGCSGPAHYIVDSYDGVVLAKLEGHVGLERRSMNHAPDLLPSKGISGEEVSWTPDGKYVISGSLDGKVFVWSVASLSELDPQAMAASMLQEGIKHTPIKMTATHRLEGDPSGPTRCVRFNQRLGMFATAGSNLAFWLPDMSESAEDVAKGVLKKRQGP
ncbi:WD40-repeat-containing domain protein [Coprinopsis sp. MPI-PUGE-AT-0042]|nr:WD40-repeat-containing domain protein [Coprinopsis sp. MPI-PUGE-AT-0042]